jgi:hypothetical protein
MTETRPIIVAFIAEFLRNPDNRLRLDELPEWRRPDGRLITIAEARVIRRATLGEIGEALELCKSA